MKRRVWLYFAILLVCPVASVQAQSGKDWRGYACTVDCSGHKAGYEWAKKKGITRYDECGGRSRSFIEGCYSWVESQQGGVQPSAPAPPPSSSGSG